MISLVRLKQRSNVVFSAAGWTDEGSHLASENVQGYVLEDVLLAIPEVHPLSLDLRLVRRIVVGMGTELQLAMEAFVEHARKLACEVAVAP